MESNVDFVIFDSIEKVKDDKELEILREYSSVVSEEYRGICLQMLQSKHFLVSPTKVTGMLDMSLFLDDEKTINLDKFELALIISCELLHKLSEKENIQIAVGGLQDYIKLRGIQFNYPQITEEMNFIQRFVSAILELEYPEASYIFKGDSYL